MKPEDQAKEYIFRSYGADSRARSRATNPFLVERELGVFFRTGNQSPVMCFASRTVKYMVYIAHECGAREVGIGDSRECTVCVYNTWGRGGGIVCNLSARVITDHSQSLKDIDSYFKSDLS